MPVQDAYRADTVNELWVPVLGAASVPWGGGAEPPPDPDPPSGDRFSFTDAQVTELRSRMTGAGPFYSTGQGVAGSQSNAPGDGERTIAFANDYLANPSASLWTAPTPHIQSNDTDNMNETPYRRPPKAAFVWLTQPGHSQSAALLSNLKALLLASARHASLDFSDDGQFQINGYGADANGAVFWLGMWMQRMMMTRDYLGRDVFTSAENAELDQWMYGYANYFAKHAHNRYMSGYVPGRLSRNYSTIGRAENSYNSSDGPGNLTKSYDGGPGIGLMGVTYQNRNMSYMAPMSFAANYLKWAGYTGGLKSSPSYGVYTIDELLDHSRIWVEELLRFACWPQGFQGDFERGDTSRYSSASIQQGWRYSINVVGNMVLMAEYHARRGDMSVWNFGTTAGYDGSAGNPNTVNSISGFPTKSVHFMIHAMCRYVNDSWGRRNYSQQFPTSNHYHDVIPAAIASRRFPSDVVLEAAWKRTGQSFPAYPSGTPQSQGPFSAYGFEGETSVGLIEHGGI